MLRKPRWQRAAQSTATVSAHQHTNPHIAERTKFHRAAVCCQTTLTDNAWSGKGHPSECLVHGSINMQKHVADRSVVGHANSARLGARKQIRPAQDISDNNNNRKKCCHGHSRRHVGSPASSTREEENTPTTKHMQNVHHQWVCKFLQCPPEAEEHASAQQRGCDEIGCRVQRTPLPAVAQYISLSDAK